MIAGLVGGIAMAIGALTWGQGILKKVAFDVVKTDLSMASAAQMVQALVVLAAVSQGLFTSMNQALIGAMTGTGLARGNQTIQWRVVRGIVTGGRSDRFLALSPGSCSIRYCGSWGSAREWEDGDRAPNPA